ncbi:hypothetical protein Tco_0312991 [Tanacetum coccineum]
MPCGAITLTKHIVEVRHVVWMNKTKMFEGLGKSWFPRFGGGAQFPFSVVRFSGNIPLSSFPSALSSVFTQLINTAYPLPLDTAYRSSGTESEFLRHFKTLSLDELRLPDFNLLSDQEYSEEEVAETMTETMEQGSDHEDANEHIEKVLEIVDLFYIPNITIDQVMLRAFPMSLTGAASRWLRNEPTGSITTWDGLKTRFMNKYCPPARTAKKMKEINNFQQEPDENLYQAWERFKELFMKCAIPSKTAADAKVAIQEMAEYSQKWHNGTSRSKSTETFDELAAIQAQLNNLGREIRKVNEKVYVAQVGCEQCKGPYYTKDCPLKEEGKTLEEAYYTQFGRPFQGGGYRATALGFYQRNNANPSYQERRQSMEDTLSKFMSESTKRHEENSNFIKKIRALIDAVIRN